MFFAMKFWLACFGLLFVGAELFQWVMQISWQFSGSGLILGGMGLALASNATHLPRIRTTSADLSQVSSEKAVDQGGVDQAIASLPHRNLEQTAQSPTDEDSISFKVRFPWR
jgi:hypothetical protein